MASCYRGSRLNSSCAAEGEDPSPPEEAGLNLHRPDRGEWTGGAWGGGDAHPQLNSRRLAWLPCNAPPSQGILSLCHRRAMPWRANVRCGIEAREVGPMSRPSAVHRATPRGLSNPPSAPSVTQGAVATRPDASQCRKLEGRHAGCVRELEEARRVLQDTVTDVIAALVAAIEMKDKYAYGHSLREAGYAVALAQAMRLPKQQVEDIRRGALIHDIGMIFVSPRIIHKPVELAEDEFEAVKKHAALGAAVVSKVHLLRDVAKIVRHHHERYDGSGYPDGLADDHIPLGARVVAVADAFEAMTEERPYRRMLTLDKALAELERHAGGQFDPRVMKTFVSLVRRKVAQSPVPQDGSLLLAEVVIDSTLTYEPSRSGGDGRGRGRRR